MSIWQFRSAVGGYAKAHAQDENSLSAEEASALADWLDAPPMWN